MLPSRRENRFDLAVVEGSAPRPVTGFHTAQRGGARSSLARAPQFLSFLSRSDLIKYRSVIFAIATSSTLDEAQGKALSSLRYYHTTTVADVMMRVVLYNNTVVVTEMPLVCPNAT